MEIINRILIIVSTTFLIVWSLIPLVKKIAFHIGAVDLPNERKIHVKPTARLGGLGIFFGFLAGYVLFGEPSLVMNSILIGSFIIVLTGIIDDIKPLDAKIKFMGQLLAAAVLVFYGNLLIKDIDFFGLYFNFDILSYPLTLFFILGCINCINLIDGLDGLSGGISSIYFLTIGIIAVMQQRMGLDFFLTFIMLGSTLGFLAHNFHPAKIFAGDTGSMFLGFIIASISLLGFKNITLTSFIIPLIILAVPILDTSFAIIRRILKGESISKPDRFHIHHQLLNRNFSQSETVLIIYFINIIFAAASIIYVLKDRILGYIIYGILFILVTFFVTMTNVVVDQKQVKSKLKLKIFSKKKKL